MPVVRRQMPGRELQPVHRLQRDIAGARQDAVRRPGRRALREVDEPPLQAPHQAQTEHDQCPAGRQRPRHMVGPYVSDGSVRAHSLAFSDITSLSEPRVHATPDRCARQEPHASAQTRTFPFASTRPSTSNYLPRPYLRGGSLAPKSHPRHRPEPGLVPGPVEGAAERGRLKFLEADGSRAINVDGSALDGTVDLSDNLWVHRIVHRNPVLQHRRRISTYVIVSLRTPELIRSSLTRFTFSSRKDQKTHIEYSRGPDICSVPPHKAYQSGVGYETADRTGPRIVALHSLPGLETHARNAGRGQNSTTSHSPRRRVFQRMEPKHFSAHRASPRRRRWTTEAVQLSHQPTRTFRLHRAQHDPGTDRTGWYV